MAKTVKVGKDGTPKTLSQIAEKQGVTLQALLAANPNIKNANKIRVGQSIKIPDTKKMPGAKGGPYGRVSQVEMNKLRRDGKEYATAVRAKMKAGAETSATPKEKAKLGNRLVGSSLSKAAEDKAKKLKLQKEGKLPKSKPKNTNPVSKKTGSSLSVAAMEKAKARKNKNATKMAMPKPKPKTQTASRTSRRKGRKA